MPISLKNNKIIIAFSIVRRNLDAIYGKILKKSIFIKDFILMRLRITL